MNEPVIAALGRAAPRLEAALQLAGFPPDSMLVICLPKFGGILPNGHVDACCCVCGADVVRSHLSVHLNSTHPNVAVGCSACVLKAMADARRMGAA